MLLAWNGSPLRPRPFSDYYLEPVGSILRRALDSLFVASKDGQIHTPKR